MCEWSCNAVQVDVYFECVFDKPHVCDNSEYAGERDRVHEYRE